MAFEFLHVLAGSRARALSKSERLDRVWPGIFVSETSLARAVSELRDCLGTRRAHVVRTIYGYGYAFAAEVEGDEGSHETAAGSSHAALCWLTSADREVALLDGDRIAGRDPATEIWLDSPKVSRRHAKFVVDRQTVTVEDLGSKNGTFVGGQRIVTRITLKPGDPVRIGPFTFV